MLALHGHFAPHAPMQTWCYNFSNSWFMTWSMQLSPCWHILTYLNFGPTTLFELLLRISSVLVLPLPPYLSLCLPIYLSQYVISSIHLYPTIHSKLRITLKQPSLSANLYLSFCFTILISREHLKHHLIFTLHYIISQCHLHMKWPVVHQQSHVHHSGASLKRWLYIFLFQVSVLVSFWRLDGRELQTDLELTNFSPDFKSEKKTIN